jgi:mevalonate kinase
MNHFAPSVSCSKQTGDISRRFVGKVQNTSDTGTELEPMIEELVDLNQNCLREIGVSHESIEKVVKITSQFGKQNREERRECFFRVSFY